MTFSITPALALGARWRWRLIAGPLRLSFGWLYYRLMNTLWVKPLEMYLLAGPEEVANRMRSGLRQGIRFVLILVGVVVLIGVVIALIRIGNNRRRMAQDQVQEKKRKTLPDGQPAPPIGRGFCQMCQRSYDEVYFFSSGTRLCPPCYKTESEKSNPSVIL